MSKLQDAAVRLHHKREREQINRFFNALDSGESFENTNHGEIWVWACKRWPKTFPFRDCEIRDQLDDNGDFKAEAKVEPSL